MKIRVQNKACGEWLEEVSKPESERHNFNSRGICDCDYQPKDTEAIDLMLQGKFYVVGAEGKHIYKRIYDPSKAIGYDDVYICTITNFDLPKGTGLILNGNYLYLDGEKICTDPYTMKNADMRIGQLNNIIKGATNAYNSGTIDKSRRNEIISEADDFVAGLVGSKVINQFDDVVAYIKKHGELPDNYITKKEARKLGWKSEKGNLAEVLPGKSIGGDVYRNAEGKLPSAIGRIWYEADINYTSGYRGKERLYYSNDGLFYKTLDHTETVIRIGE